jgi:hypothetical protein
MTVFDSLVDDLEIEAPERKIIRKQLIEELNKEMSLKDITDFTKELFEKEKKENTDD